MLDGRYPSKEFGELRARIVWDRVAGTIRARKGARQLAVANAGTIPDRGLYAVTLPDGRRVGELDEEMVYEARPGQAFLLGASTWRIEEIGRDRVIVTPAPGAPGAVPFWKGDSVGRPKELGRGDRRVLALGCRAGRARRCERDYDLDQRAARNLLDYLREQQAATRVLPSDRTIVLERFRDEIGDWRLCILSPYGARVHAAWGLALSARIRERFGLEADAIWSDDGIIVHLPDLDADDAEALPGVPSWCCSSPTRSSRRSPPSSAARRCSARAFARTPARALLIPRAYPGPAHAAVAAAPEGPEPARGRASATPTSRSCSRPIASACATCSTCRACRTLLRGLHTREISLVEVETPTASPFASSLLFDYVATYMYEGDTPNAERRAAALVARPRPAARAARPGGAARADRPRRARSASRTTCSAARELHARDRPRRAARRAAPRRRPQRARRSRERVLEGIDAGGLLRELQRERRAIRLRVGGEERYIAADEAGLYRDALGAVPPGGLPEAFLADVPDALRVLVARYARTHGPFTTAELHARYGVDASAVLRELGALGRARARRAAPGRRCEREWCDVEVLRRLRRASLAALRKEIEPADSARAGGLPALLAGRRPPLRRRARGSTGCARCSCRCRASRCRWRSGSATCCRGASAPTRQRGSTALCASGEVVWVGAGAIGRAPGAWRCTSARTRPLIGAARRCRARARAAQRRRARRGARAAARAPRARAVLLHRSARRARCAGGGAARGALGPRVGGRGDQRRVGAAARAASGARPRRAPRRAGARRAPGRRGAAGPIRRALARSRFGTRRGARRRRSRAAGR